MALGLGIAFYLIRQLCIPTQERGNERNSPLLTALFSSALLELRKKSAYRLRARHDLGLVPTLPRGNAYPSQSRVTTQERGDQRKDL